MIILKNKDVPVAVFNEDLEVVEIKNEKLLPLHFRYGWSLKGWVESRAIDTSRVSSRLLKRALRMREKDDYSTAMKVHARTLTDNFWLTPDNNTLTYKDLQFKSDSYSDLTLNLDTNIMDSETDNFTPELTNTGSYEKGWKLKNNEWYLFKKGNKAEIFSEVFTYLLGKELGFRMAEYKVVNHYSVSKDFTKGGEVNYQPMFGVVGEDEDYSRNYKELEKLGKHLLVDYLNMLYLDTIVRNVDRHTKNYGLLTDIETGKILRFAPNFDNNLSLIATGYPKSRKRENDFLVKLFKALIIDEKIAYIPPILTKKCVHKIVGKSMEETGFEPEVNRIIDMCIYADQQLNEICHTRYSLSSDFDKVCIKHHHSENILNLNNIDVDIKNKLYDGNRIGDDFKKALINL